MTDDYAEHLGQHDEILRSLAAMLAVQHEKNQAYDAIIQEQREMNRDVKALLQQQADFNQDVKTGADFCSGRAGIATNMRYTFGLPRQGFQRRPMPDAMPTRQHTRR